jgi:hypothetical protein
VPVIHPPPVIACYAGQAVDRHVEMCKQIKAASADERSQAVLFGRRQRCLLSMTGSSDFILRPMYGDVEDFTKGFCKRLNIGMLCLWRTKGMVVGDFDVNIEGERNYGLLDIFRYANEHDGNRLISKWPGTSRQRGAWGDCPKKLEAVSVFSAAPLRMRIEVPDSKESTKRYSPPPYSNAMLLKRHWVQCNPSYGTMPPPVAGHCCNATAMYGHVTPSSCLQTIDDAGQPSSSMITYYGIHCGVDPTTLPSVPYCSPVTTISYTHATSTRGHHDFTIWVILAEDEIKPAGDAPEHRRPRQAAIRPRG